MRVGQTENGILKIERVQKEKYPNNGSVRMCVYKHDKGEKKKKTTNVISQNEKSYSNQMSGEIWDAPVLQPTAAAAAFSLIADARSHGFQSSILWPLHIHAFSY